MRRTAYVGTDCQWWKQMKNERSRFRVLPDSFAICSLSAALLVVTACTPHDRYTDIRVPAGAPFRFPTQDAVLSEIRTNQKTPDIRSHAWSIFAGVIQPSNASDPSSIPIWQTWYSRDTDLPQGCRHRDQAFVPDFDKQMEVLTLSLDGGTPGPDVFRGGILYNREACEHIISHGLQDVQVLDSINEKLNKLGSPPQERDILPFARGSIVVKAAWTVAKKGGAIQYWDGTQFKSTAVDTTPGKDCRHDQSVLYTSCMFHIDVTSDNVHQIGTAVGADVGDAVVLMGLHIITKELADWTWSTFWWTNDPKDPKGVDRLGPDIIPAPWSNYAMDTTLSMVTPNESAFIGKNTPPAKKNGFAAKTSAMLPTTPPDCPHHEPSSAKICFNPYIERGLTETNCMHCHKQATYPKIVLDDYTTPGRGYIGSDAACFDNRLRVDYLWSLGKIAPSTSEKRK
jgi:hypothetical protein